MQTSTTCVGLRPYKRHSEFNARTKYPLFEQ